MSGAGSTLGGQALDGPEAAAPLGEALIEQARRLGSVRSVGDGAPSTTTISRRPPCVALATTLNPAAQVKPGLHPVGAGIAADQAVMIGDDHVAELQRADAVEVAVLGEILEQRARDHRHVARRGDVARDRAVHSD